MTPELKHFYDIFINATGRVNSQQQAFDWLLFQPEFETMGLNEAWDVSIQLTNL